jgi:hypothetical protein
VHLSDLKRVFLRSFAQKLQNWGESILEKLAAGERPDAASGMYGAREPGGPEGRTKPGAGGPPAHWVERVRQAAPGLLRPSEAPQPPTPAMGEVSEETTATPHRSEAAPRATPFVRADRQRSGTSTAGESAETPLGPILKQRRQRCDAGRAHERASQETMQRVSSQVFSEAAEHSHAGEAQTAGERPDVASGMYEAREPGGPEGRAKPGAGGPPAHWVERVQQAAPELLRPSEAPQTPTPVMGKVSGETTAAPRRSEAAPRATHFRLAGQRSVPSTSGESAEMRLGSILQEQRQRREAVQARERAVQEPTPSEHSRAAGAGEHHSWGAPRPSTHPIRHHRPPAVDAVGSQRVGVIVEASTARSATPAAPQPAEDPWPDLLESSSSSSADEWAAALREQERLRRLDLEQRGMSWSV